MKFSIVIRLVLGIFLALLVLNSCTVNERLYMPGYDVNWHTSKNNTKRQKGEEKKYITNNLVNTSDEDMQFSFRHKSLNTNNTVFEEIVAMAGDNEQVVVPIKKENPITVEAHNYESPEENKNIEEFSTDNKRLKQSDEVKIEPFGMIGFIVSILGLFSLLGAGWLMLPASIIAILFGAISLKRIRMNPYLYKGREFAIASLILGTVELFFIILIYWIVLAIIFAIL